MVLLFWCYCWNKFYQWQKYIHQCWRRKHFDLNFETITAHSVFPWPSDPTGQTATGEGMLIAGNQQDFTNRKSETRLHHNIPRRAALGAGSVQDGGGPRRGGLCLRHWCSARHTRLKLNYLKSNFKYESPDHVIVTTSSLLFTVTQKNISNAPYVLLMATITVVIMLC